MFCNAQYAKEFSSLNPLKTDLSEELLRLIDLVNHHTVFLFPYGGWGICGICLYDFYGNINNGCEILEKY